ncbi:MAG TPA: Rrf2 family transcriptional regulator [Methylomirabilota bacterium]|jgi:Rrf2 family protein|nr:Rrf2 family transcriptional regulator [Methylomirabilota bacterium]
MRISAKGEYAIRAMLDLALHQGQGLIPIQDVARRQGIPQRYLEQVLLLLKRAGFLASKRGSTGGYRLVRPPGEISVGDVLRVIEGSLTPLEVAGRAPRERRDGGRDLAELWQAMADAVATVIDRTTFEELAERAAARRSPGRTMYHI